MRVVINAIDNGSFFTIPCRNEEEAERRASMFGLTYYSIERVNEELES